jgi:CMP-N-acetylneuraminic acid synthetase
MEILGVIPARGGSKAVPRKNIRQLAGKPLIAYTIETSLQSGMLTDVVVSTDDEEIQEISIRYGAQAPFLRPAELSTDTALALPTMQHAVQEMEQRKQKKYDYVVMLQPTSPLRSVEDIDESLNKLIASGADGLISIVHVDNNHPMKMKRLVGDRLVDYETPPIENPPRQILPPVYIMNGVIFATSRDVMMLKNTFQGEHCIGYLMGAERSVDIDTEIDFMVVEQLLTKKHQS